MKKGSLIVGGAIVLAILVAIWLYLLFFGTPNNPSEVFANLGLTEERDRTPMEFEDEMESPTDETPATLPKQALRQLTFKPAAGVFVPDLLFPKFIRYAERGTGYIYEIDIATGVERQVTTLTVSQTAEARFSPQGTSVIFTSYIDGVRTSVISVFPTTTGSTTDVVRNLSLPPGADNLSYESDNAVLYTITQSEGSVGYRYDLDTQTRTEIFRIPMTQITMVWGNGLESMYVYPKPSRYLEGFVYELIGSDLHWVGSGANGLMYTRNNKVALRTTADLKKIETTLMYGTASIATPIPFMPEKCSFVDTDSTAAWCASSVEKLDPSFPEAWYAGHTTSDDSLWQIETASGTVMDERIKLSETAGRLVDVASIQATTDGFSVFFTNKIDGTVWLYDSLAEVEAANSY